jgi:hypothetical protein
MTQPVDITATHILIGSLNISTSVTTESTNINVTRILVSPEKINKGVG